MIGSKYIIAILAVLGTGFFTTGSASALTISSTQEIKVTAVVLPAKRILVDNNNQIIEIASNTSLDNVSPTVYRNNDSAANKIMLSNDIHEQYKRITKNKLSQPGILYKNDIAAINKRSVSTLTFSFTLPNLKITLLSF